jgi:hypothetical protein
MKRALFAVVVLALAAIGVIYSEIGLAEVVHAVVLVGWGIVLVVAVRFAIMFLLAYGWWLVIPRMERPSFHDCVNLRLVRDAVNSLLPVAQVGGDIVAARYRRIHSGHHAVRLYRGRSARAFMAWQGRNRCRLRRRWPAGGPAPAPWLCCDPEAGCWSARARCAAQACRRAGMECFCSHGHIL